MKNICKSIIIVFLIFIFGNISFSQAKAGQGYKIAVSVADYAVVSANNKFGFYNIVEGVKILPIEYDSIDVDKNYQVITARKSNQVVMFQIQQGKLVLLYDSSRSKEENSILMKNIRKDFNAGSPNGNNASPQKVKTVLLGNDEGAIMKKGSKYGVINVSKNKIIIPFGYSNIEYVRWKFPYGFKVRHNEQVGYIDSYGKAILPCSYQDVIRMLPETSNLFVIKEKDKQGVVYNQNGTIKEEVPAIFDEIIDNSYIVKKDGKYGLYNSSVKAVSIPVIYDRIRKVQYQTYEYGYMKGWIVTKDKKKGFYIPDFVNKTNTYKLAVPVEFDNAEVVAHGCIVTHNGKKGYYHLDKGLMLSTKYDDIKMHTVSDKFVIGAKKGANTIKKDVPLSNYYKKVTKNTFMQDVYSTFIPN